MWQSLVALSPHVHHLHPSQKISVGLAVAVRPLAFTYTQFPQRAPEIHVTVSLSHLEGIRSFRECYRAADQFINVRF